MCECLTSYDYTWYGFQMLFSILNGWFSYYRKLFKSSLIIIAPRGWNMLELLFRVWLFFVWQETSELDIRRDSTASIQAYANRFLKHNTSNVVLNKVEMPLTPDRVSDMGVIDLSWEDNLTEVRTLTCVKLFLFRMICFLLHVCT